MTAINTSAAHTASVARLTSLSAQIDVLQGQIATGKRVTASADDPVAFTRAAAIRRSETADITHQSTIDAASRRLSAIDTALASVSTIIQRAKEIGLQARNATLSADDRTSLAVEAAELMQQAATLAETRGDDGETLFGGASAAGPVYTLDITGMRVWQGSGSAPALAVGGGRVVTGITGPQAFGNDATGLFATLDGLTKALTEPDDTLRGSSLDKALTNLDGQVSHLADTRASVGVRMARLDSESERITSAKTADEAGLTKLEGLDMTEAIARLQRLMTVLQAAQASFVKVSALSLWELLR